MLFLNAIGGGVVDLLTAGNDRTTFTDWLVFHTNKQVL